MMTTISLAYIRRSIIFGVVELGGFYLDVIKDRQYTLKSDSLARRSTQTAMFHILEMFSRLIAPIISFTADEIWENIPGDRADSVFLTNFSDAVEDLPELSELDDQYWSTLMEVRSAVNKELEVKRSEKVIGSGLSAELELFCSANLMADLKRLEEELRFVLIVSKASVYDIDDADSSAKPTGITGLKIRVESLISKSVIGVGIIMSVLVKTVITLCFVNVVLPTSK